MASRAPWPPGGFRRARNRALRAEQAHRQHRSSHGTLDPLPLPNADGLTPGQVIANLTAHQVPRASVPKHPGKQPTVLREKR